MHSQPRNQFNFGVSYQMSSAFAVGLDWLYGTSFGGNIAFQLGPTTDAYPQHIGDAPLPPLHVRTQDEQQQALNHLLELHNPQLCVSATKVAMDQRNALVDALWSQNPAPGDVAINGRTLMIRIAAGSPQAICASMSQLVGTLWRRYRHGDGRAWFGEANTPLLPLAVRCALVPRRIAGRPGRLDAIRPGVPRRS